MRPRMLPAMAARKYASRSRPDLHEWLAKSFEAERAHLRAALANRILGSGNEADDAVQELWLRLSRSDAGAIENMGGWLLTVVARMCLAGFSRRIHPRPNCGGRSEGRS